MAAATSAGSPRAAVQPFVGLLAVSLLVYTLRKRLNTYRLAACPVPV